MFFKPQPVHFVGIGGIGMSGLAEILLEMGYPVSGSDLRCLPITEGLAQRGATIYQGHEAANLGDAKARGGELGRSAKAIPKSRKRGG